MKLVLGDRLEAKSFGFVAGNISNLSCSIHDSGLADINDLVARCMHVRLVRVSTLNEYRLRDRRLCIRVFGTMPSGRYPYEARAHGHAVTSENILENSL